MYRILSNNISRTFSRFAYEDSSAGNQTANIELTTLTPTTSLNQATSNQSTYTAKSVNGCKDVSDFFQIFDSHCIKEEIENVEDTLLLYVNVEQHFEALRTSEHQQLAKKCKNKSIVVVIMTKNEDKFFIYWKIKNLQHFLTFFPYNNTPVLTEKCFIDYFANFLADSLANGHLGICRAAIKYYEKNSNVELHAVADHRGFNLLLLAAESGDNDVVKILLEQKLETVAEHNKYNVRVQDLAWNGKHYEVVLTLMKIGLTYPAAFDITKCSDELKQFCETSEELHSAVIARDTTKIEALLNQDSNSHPFYNRINESAAKIALNMKLMEIYKILVNNKVFLGRNEILHHSWEHCTIPEREILREIHFKNSIHMSEKHLTDLTSSSSVSHDDGNVIANLNLVQYAFEILNQNPLIRIILMIVAASKRVKILFDFKSDSVHDVDPTAGLGMRGLFYIHGMICVAAEFLLSQSRENETFGTLAHELCHCAINLVYRNRAKPYRRKDRDRRREFAGIVKICQQNRKKEHLIDQAFEDDPSVHHAELIVRVPHLLALYHNQPEKLKTARENFIELFEYYEQKVVPDMKEALPKIEKSIEQLDEKILKNKIILVLTIILSFIAIIAVSFSMWWIFYNPILSFNELSIDEQATVANSTINYKNIDVKFSELFPDNSSAYEKLTSDNIKRMLSGQNSNFSDSSFHYLEDFVIHNWNHLAPKLRQKILNSNFTFQNESLKFKVAHSALPFLTHDQIISILDGKNLKVDKLIKNQTDFIVDRTFFDELDFLVFYEYEIFVSKIPDGMFYTVRNKFLASENEFEKFFDNFIMQNATNLEKLINETDENIKFKAKLESRKLELSMMNFTTFHKNFDEIIERVEKSRIFILSSEAGAGKSTTFADFTIRIKRKFPNRWVSFIDLRDHVRLYKNESLEDILSLLKDILGLNATNKFENNFFDYLFDSGKVILLWNGFDEISPTYSDFVLHLLDKIHKNSSNIQFVSTRPLYKDKLKNHFQIFPYKFVPFDTNKQNEFLEKFFLSRNVEEKNVEKLIEKIFKILNNLTTKLWAFETPEEFNTPLLLDMIAGLMLSDTEISKSENLFQIYQKFIVTKVDIWKNRTIENESIEEKYALQNEISAIDLTGFTKFAYSKLKLNTYEIPVELSNDEISRMGILYIKNLTVFKFSHETFSDFFIAQFIIDNVFDEKVEYPENAQSVLKIFFNIINLRHVQYFINSFIETKKNGTFDEIIVKTIREKFPKVLFQFGAQIYINEFKFFLNFFKKDYLLLRDMLHVDENETFYTSMFNYANQYFESSNATQVKNIVKNYLNESDFDKFIRGKYQKGIILFSSYLYGGKDNWTDYPNISWTVYRHPYSKTIVNDFYNLDENVRKNTDPIAVFKMVVENLTNSELIEFFTSKTSPITWNIRTLFSFDEFWEIANKNLVRSDLKKLFQNLLYAFTKSSFISSSDEFPRFFNRISNLFNSSEIVDIFTSRNILHSAAATNFDVFWFYFTKYSTTNDQIEILKSQIDGECFKNFAMVPNDNCYYEPPLNILQIAMIYKNSEIKFYYDQIFNAQVIQEIIFMGSSDFLLHLITRSTPRNAQPILILLKTVFKNDRNKLYQILKREILPTKLNISEYIKTFDPRSEKNLNLFRELFES